MFLLRVLACTETAPQRQRPLSKGMMHGSGRWGLHKAERDHKRRSRAFDQATFACAHDDLAQSATKSAEQARDVAGVEKAGPS